IKSTKRYKQQKKLKIIIPKNNQEFLSKDIMNRMQMLLDVSSIDPAEHPFTVRMSENDVRITTNYRNLTFSFESTMHEAGHALYELNLPKKYYNTVLYEGPSLGIHESQSRFWENMIGKNKLFWQGYFNFFKKHSKIKKSQLNFYKDYNIVKPSYVRVESDEVTYCLHIILRFEIERDLINGIIKPKDAKKEWNKRFKELFGIAVKKDSEGILQDVHWSGGGIGYFPCYAIGSIYAAQQYYKMQKDIPNFKQKIKTLKFKPILQWLIKNIHSKGRTMLADDIVKKATGESLNPKIFIKYLNEKYKEIYKFK
ncbi:carboxypeptidase M32, partial [Nanoarchaeota archaeon]